MIAPSHSGDANLMALVDFTAVADRRDIPVHAPAIRDNGSLADHAIEGRRKFRLGLAGDDDFAFIDVVHSSAPTLRLIGSLVGFGEPDSGHIHSANASAL